MATKPPTQTLEVTELNEVSLVEAGDNPDAGVCLMKRRPTPSPLEKSMPDGTPDPEIAKRDAERDAEIAKMAAEIAAFKKERAISDIEKRIGANLADLAADIYEIGKSAPDAAKRIEERLLKLERQAAQVEKLTRPVGGAGGKVDGDDRLAKAIAPLMAKGMTRAAAVVKALESDPTLYTDTTEARS